MCSRFFLHCCVFTKEYISYTERTAPPVVCNRVDSFVFCILRNTKLCETGHCFAGHCPLSQLESLFRHGHWHRSLFWPLFCWDGTKHLVWKFFIFLCEVVLLLEFFTLRTSFAPLHILDFLAFSSSCVLFPESFWTFSQGWTKKYETRFAWHSREYAIRNTKLSTLAATVYTAVCLSRVGYCECCCLERCCLRSRCCRCCSFESRCCECLSCVYCWCGGMLLQVLAPYFVVVCWCCRCWCCVCCCISVPKKEVQGARGGGNVKKWAR